MKTYQDNQSNKYTREAGKVSGTDHKALFEPAYKLTAKWEGGYANVTGDRGGETYAGISRKYHATWKGWVIVDRNKPLKWNQIIKDDALHQMIRDFYYFNFWTNISCEHFESQDTANFVYDWHVNSGRSAIKSIQSTLGLVNDGVVGKMTIKAINEADLNTLIDARVGFVENIVERDPDQEKFLAGWLARIEAYR